MRTLTAIILVTLILAAPGIGDIVVQLTEGENLISINVIPPVEMYLNEDDPGPDFELMFERIMGHVLLIRDSEGCFCNPSWGFNNLGCWDLTRAYLVSVDEDIEIEWEGEQIPADADIPLNQGENWIAYYPQYELDASAPDFYVLSPIIEFVESANDMMGGEMNPAEEFSNMEPWRPGRGYMVNVNDDVVLNYPPQPEGVSDSFVTPSSFRLLQNHPNPFNSTTTITYSLPIPSSVTVKIYNSRGQLIDILLDRVMPAGAHSVVWDGSGMATGVYLVRVRDESGWINAIPVVLVK